MNIFERTKLHEPLRSDRGFRDEHSAELVYVLAVAAANLGTLKAASDLFERSKAVSRVAPRASRSPDCFGAAVALP